MAKAIQIDGKKFASLRQKHLKTQAEIAESLGVTVGRVVGIESKAKVGMYARNFRRLAGTFGITVDELLNEIGAATEPSPTVPVAMERSVYERAMSYAEAEGVTGEQWLSVAVEAFMRLQGSPEEIRKSKSKRVMATPTRRIAAKNLDKEK